MLFNFTIFFVNVFPGESLGFGRMVHFPLLVYFSSVSVIISCYSFRIVLWWHNNDEESIAKSKLENKTINSYFLWNKRRDNLLVVAKHCSYTGTVLQHLKMFGTVTYCWLGLPRSDRNLSENGTCHQAARVLHWLRLALSCWIILPFIHLGVNLKFSIECFLPPFSYFLSLTLHFFPPSLGAPLFGSECLLDGDHWISVALNSVQ